MNAGTRIVVVTLLLVVTTTAATAISFSQNRKDTMKIKMTIEGHAIIATLEENPSARDFFSMLPLTLPLEDYAATEKIAYLPRKLTTQEAPKGIDPDVGDLTYYAPWGNMAIFYRDFSYSTGLVKLGRIESGLAHLSATPAATVTIEAIK